MTGLRVQFEFIIKLPGRPRSQNLFPALVAWRRSAGFQACRTADFQVGHTTAPLADLETRDTAGLEARAALTIYGRPLRSLPAVKKAWRALHFMVRLAHDEG
jgi:hypothetical protein